MKRPLSTAANTTFPILKHRRIVTSDSRVTTEVPLPDIPSATTEGSTTAIHRPNFQPKSPGTDQNPAHCTFVANWTNPDPSKNLAFAELTNSQLCAEVSKLLGLVQSMLSTVFTELPSKEQPQMVTKFKLKDLEALSNAQVVRTVSISGRPSRQTTANSHSEVNHQPSQPKPKLANMLRQSQTQNVEAENPHITLDSKPKPDMPVRTLGEEIFHLRKTNDALLSRLAQTQNAYQEEQEHSSRLDELARVVQEEKLRTDELYKLKVAQLREASERIRFLEERLGVRDAYSNDAATDENENEYENDDGTDSEAMEHEERDEKMTTQQDWESDSKDGIRDWSKSGSADSDEALVRMQKEALKSVKRENDEDYDMQEVAGLASPRFDLKGEGRSDWQVV